MTTLTARAEKDQLGELLMPLKLLINQLTKDKPLMKKLKPQKRLRPRQKLPKVQVPKVLQQSLKLRKRSQKHLHQLRRRHQKQRQRRRRSQQHLLNRSPTPAPGIAHLAIGMNQIQSNP